MIGIIGAMEVEVEILKEKMVVEEVLEKASMSFYRGCLLGKEAVIVRSGIGKVNAAVCTQILVDHFAVELVINTGIAGSLQAIIDIGDIVISTDALQHDMDAVGFGYAPGIIPQMEQSIFQADEKMVTLAEQICRQVNPEIKTHKGRVVSGDQFICSKEVKQKIKDQFNGYCTEMEGAAIAQTAWLNHIPFVIIRAISDKADDSAEIAYSEFEALAVKHSINLIEGLVQNL